MPPEDIPPEFDKAEVDCLSGVTSEHQRLEVKRRVAERKVRLLCDRDASLPVVEGARSGLLKMGFTNLEIEVGMEIYFAKYCLRHQRTEIAQATLRKLRSKLNAAIKSADLEVYRHLKNEVTMVLVST